MRALQLSPGPPARVRRTTSGLWATSAVLLVVGAGLYAAVDRGEPPGPGGISDISFVAAANARCAQTAKGVVEANRQPLSGEAEVARYQRLASGWEAMVADLRDLPIAPTDAAAVDGWLQAWDRWTSLGHDYANAMAARDEAEASSIIERSRIPKKAMTDFADANALDACIFR